MSTTLCIQSSFNSLTGDKKNGTQNLLTDLHAYNNGALIGDWVNISEFDRDDDNFSQICERCGIKA